MVWGVRCSHATGERLLGGAGTQVERVAPELQSVAEQWIPGVAALGEQLADWWPGQAPEPPHRDVSGDAVGPVSRYPGLVRRSFRREPGAVAVEYAGTAAFDAVLAHYVAGFAAAGYRQQVLAADAAGERHRFQRERDTIDLALWRRPAARVELELKVSSL